MIKITADSTCDLSPDILNSMDIMLMPLTILLGDKPYRDGVDITPVDIFRYVDEGGESCKTAAVNAYEYERFFKGLSLRYEAVVHICIGSGFSSCFQNATLAAMNFKNVYVVDSQNLSSASGHVVYEAALMARNGANAEDICRSLEELIPKVDGSFVIDRLEYLHKGGRCSGIESFGAKMLQIRPCIEMTAGKMEVGKKYRGSFEGCLRRYVQDRLNDTSNIDFGRVFITHSSWSQQTVNTIKELLLNDARFERVMVTPAGCTVASHCGPNTLGILYIRKSKKLDYYH